MDRWTLRFSDWVAGGSLHPLFQAIEPFGAPIASAALASIVAAIVARNRGFLPGVAVLGGFATIAIVEGLLRVRLHELPWTQAAEFVSHPYGWGLVHSEYPSGHTARLAFLAGVAALTFARGRPVSLTAALMITALIAVQRVEARNHEGSDVVGGALLAWGLVVVVWAFVQTQLATKNQPFEYARGEDC